MKKMLLLILVFLASAVIIRGFFMPWAKVQSSVTRLAEGVTESVKKPLKETPVAKEVVEELEKVTKVIGEFGDIELKTTVRGYDIPQMVNRKTSKVALSLSQILFKGTEGLDKKSYLVYLLPFFAIVCAELAVIGLKKKKAIIAMLIISGAISIGGFYNLLTADFSNLFVNITIEKGLWYTMYGYLSIFAIGIIWLSTNKAVK